MSAESLPTTRPALLAHLVDEIESRNRPHPLRVAIDGPDAAGKTTLADELAAVLADRGRAPIRASIDGFHRPRADRYRRGGDSPVGYYEDSFDYPALRKVLLDPLGPSGDRAYHRAVFDFRSDAARVPRPEVAPDDAVLVFDGVFLLRPELVDVWDFAVFVSVGFDEMLRRAMDRDEELFGSRAEVVRRYRARYIPGQQHYFAVARPTERADLVVHNDDPRHPTLETGTTT